MCITHLDVAALQDFLQDVFADEVDRVFEARVVPVDVVAFWLGSVFGRAIRLDDLLSSISCSKEVVLMSSAVPYASILMAMGAFRSSFLTSELLGS